MEFLWEQEHVGEMNCHEKQLLTLLAVFSINGGWNEMIIDALEMKLKCMTKIIEMIWETEEEIFKGARISIKRPPLVFMLEIAHSFFFFLSLLYTTKIPPYVSSTNTTSPLTHNLVLSDKLSFWYKDPCSCSCSNLDLDLHLVLVNEQPWPEPRLGAQPLPHHSAWPRLCAWPQLLTPASS